MSFQSIKYAIGVLLLMSHSLLLTKADVFVKRGVEGTWKTMKPTDAIPNDAIYAGYTEGDVKQHIYIGRFHIDGSYVPASISWINLWGAQNTRSIEFISEGKIIRKTEDYQILVNPNDGSHYEWVFASNGYVPENAVIVGYSKESANPSTLDALYVGRIYFKDGLLVGKVSTMNKCIFVPIYGHVYHQADYEVLVKVPK